jgi:hypothetical protein
VEEFWGTLQGTEVDVAEEDPTITEKQQQQKEKKQAKQEASDSEDEEDEDEDEEDEDAEVHDWLYQVASVNDEAKVTPVEAEEFTRNHLQSNCCYVLDCDTEVSDSSHA